MAGRRVTVERDANDGFDAPAQVRCAPWVSWVPGEGELVLFNGKDGLYHTLNGSAARIWMALSEGHQPREIAESIGREHGIGADLVAPDVAAFVTQALGKNLLVAE